MKSLPKDKLPVKLEYPSRIKSIPWYKQDSKESESYFVQELNKKFRENKGYFFILRLREMLCQNYDIWNPGCLRMKERLFFVHFDVTKRTALKILDFCKEQGKIFHGEEAGYRIIYYPEFAKITRRYRNKLMTLDEKNNIVVPENASCLTILCERLCLK